LEKPKVNHLIKFFVKLIVSLSALSFVVYKIDFENIVVIYSHTRIGWLLVAMALFVVSKVISSFRLNHLFRQISIHIDETVNLKLYWLGMYYNIFLPGGIGGDGYKAYLLKKSFQAPTKRILSTIFLDRLNGVFGLFLLSLLFFALLFNSLWIQLSLAGIIPISYLAHLLFIRKVFPSFKPIIHRITGYSILVQLSQVLAVHFILRAWEIPVETYLVYMAIFLISSVVAILPVTIGGGQVHEN